MRRLQPFIICEWAGSLTGQWVNRAPVRNAALLFIRKGVVSVGVVEKLTEYDLASGIPSPQQFVSKVG